MFSYKGKKTVKSVECLINNSVNDIHITLIDKHPIDREERFADFKNFTYVHDFWDDQTSPIKIRYERLQVSSSDYSLIVSDDIFVNPGWDTSIIPLAEKAIVSGTGKLTIDQKDKFFIGRSYESSDSFTLTNFIDRNFIFAKTDILKTIPFPTKFKYHGEEEMLSLEIFCRGYDIYSVPEGTYIDSHSRNLENLFCPFSLEHNYNTFVDVIKNPDPEYYVYNEMLPRPVDKFVSFHGIDIDKLTRLPFQKNDVTYDSYSMNMDDMGGRRFTDDIRSID